MGTSASVGRFLCSFASAVTARLLVNCPLAVYSMFARRDASACPIDVNRFDAAGRLRPRPTACAMRRRPPRPRRCAPGRPSASRLRQAVTAPQHRQRAERFQLPGLRVDRAARDFQPPVDRAADRALPIRRARAASSCTRSSGRRKTRQAASASSRARAAAARRASAVVNRCRCRSQVRQQLVGQRHDPLGRFAGRQRPHVGHQVRQA